MEERNRIILAAIKSLLNKGEMQKVIAILNKLHPADAAEVVEALPDAERKRVFEAWDVPHTADMLPEMSEEEQVGVAELLSTPLISDIFEEMAPDDVVDLLSDLSEETRERILTAMKREDAQQIARLMKYGEKTAGGLMTPEFVALRKDMTVSEAIERLRKTAPPAETIYYVFVINDEGQLVGVISLRDLIIAEPNQRIESVMNPNVIYVEVETDQEDVAKLMSRYDLLALPVVDEDHRLLGIVTVDDIMDVIEDEATEDIYRLGGLSWQERIESPAREKVSKRLPWMIINLGTAFLAAWVVGLFEESIAKVVALAIFMPVVAGMGGNGGTQALTVVTRGIALGEVEFTAGIKVVLKEIGVGILIGAATGILTALIAYLWRGNPFLGFVLFLAMVLNMAIAGLTGAGIPLLLKFFGQDPALGSGVLVTTFTDVFGFLSFLGLATVFIKYLV